MMGVLLAQTTSHPGCIFIWMRQFLLLLVRFVQAVPVLLVNPMQRHLSRCSNWVLLRQIRPSSVGNRSRSALRNRQKVYSRELCSSHEGRGQGVSQAQPDNLTWVSTPGWILGFYSVRQKEFYERQQKHGIIWGVGQLGIDGSIHCISARGRSCGLAKARWCRTYISKHYGPPLELKWYLRCHSILRPLLY